MFKVYSVRYLRGRLPARHAPSTPLERVDTAHGRQVGEELTSEIPKSLRHNHRGPTPAFKSGPHNHRPNHIQTKT